MKRRILGCIAACFVAAGLLSQPARANLFVGYLSECLAVTATTCTENTGGSYARQPIIFTVPAFGKVVNSIPYAFAVAAGSSIAGHALYAAPTGGSPLLIMPLATPLALAQPGDRGDVGALSFTVTAINAAFNGSFSHATITAGATVGPTQDGSNATAASPLTITQGEMYLTGGITW